MGAVTVYTSEDVGAPALTGEAGSLINVLSKILVEGYGSKAAAGWTKPFTGTNKAAFKMAAGTPSMYLRIDDTNAQDARIVAYVSMTDVDTGTSPFPTSGQQAGGLYCRKSMTADSEARPWYCIANDKAFYIFTGQGHTSLGAQSSSNTYVDYYIGFGKFVSRRPNDPYAVFIQASTDASPSGQFFPQRLVPNASSLTLQNTGLYLAGNLSNVQSSTLANVASVGFSSRPCSALANDPNNGYLTPYPDPLTGGTELAVAMVVESVGGKVGIRGSLPGFWHIPCSSFGSHLATFAGGGDFAGKQFVLARMYIVDQSAYAFTAHETNGDWGI